MPSSNSEVEEPAEREEGNAGELLLLPEAPAGGEEVESVQHEDIRLHDPAPESPGTGGKAGLRRKLTLEQSSKLQKNFMARRGTFKWMVEDYQRDISAPLMFNAANASHPRVYTSDGMKKVPLCTPTGNLNSVPAENEEDIHAVGMALTVYLKLMKSLIYFFIFASLFMMPLAYVYSHGQMASLNE